jgi:hypothetical protein
MILTHPSRISRDVGAGVYAKNSMPSEAIQFGSAEHAFQVIVKSKHQIALQESGRVKCNTRKTGD